MSRMQGHAAQTVMISTTLARLQAIMRFPELEHVPLDKWEAYIDRHNPELPVAANVARLQYGQWSPTDFVAKVPTAWSDRVRDLAAKLNATAMVIALQEPVRDPVLASLEADISRALAADNLLAALWLLITVFFSEGEEAASYFFVALEARAMATETSAMIEMAWLGTTTVPRLDIPAPHDFWKEPNWYSPRSVMSLVLTLACPMADIRRRMTMLSRSLGEPEPDIAMMDKEPSISLRQQYLFAKKEAEASGKTTIFGVDLVDKGLRRLEEENPGFEKNHLSFRRMFLMGICPKGVKIWQAGGDGRSATLKQHNERQGPGTMKADEVEQFMLDFDRIVGDGRGRWNTKSYKWYERCFGVDLRGLQREKGQSLLVKYEAWVQLYTVWDVKKEHMAKLKWE